MAPRTGKIIKNRVTKLEFTSTKNWLFWNRLGT